MKSRPYGIALILLSLLLVAAPLLSAQAAGPGTKAPAQAAAPAATQTASGTPATPGALFRADFLKGLDDLEKKFVSLAEAAPQEKMNWKPGEGVRSYAEVLQHVASGNYGYAALLGTPPPANYDRKTFEKSTTEKAKIIENLHNSYAAVRQAVLKMQDSDLSKPARNGNVQTLLFGLATHQPEHLGQLIAYARMNNITPPWTAEREEQQKKAAPATAPK